MFAHLSPYAPLWYDDVRSVHLSQHRTQCEKNGDEMSRVASKCHRSFSGRGRTAITALFLVLAFGCTPQSELSQLECDDDTDCSELAECIDGYCVDIPHDSRLGIEIDGLPADAQPEIEVSGPGDFFETVSGETLFDDLRAGTYEIQPHPFESAPAVYEADAVTVQLAEDAGQLVQIDYGAVPGSVQVNVEGLPDGATPVIQLLELDDDGVSIGHGVEPGEVADGIPPGDYTVSADPVLHEGDEFAAPDVEITVESNELTEVTLDFLSVFGELTVDVEGLPEGVDHDIELVGEATYTVPQSGVLQAVEPGDYSLQPAVVEHTDTPGDYDAPLQEVTIERAETTNTQVDYEPVLGELTVAFDGVPDGIERKATVTGPDGFEATDVGDQTLGDLTPGDYTVEFHRLESPAGNAWEVDGDNTVDTVVYSATRDESEALATGTYEVVTGELELTIGGLDIPGQNAADPNVTVVDENDETVAQIDSQSELDDQDSIVVDDLEPGEYDVLAGEAQEGPADFTADDESGLQITSEQSAQHTIDYSAVDGELTISSTGLDGDLEARADVSGPGGYSAQDVGEETLSELLPGEYTVTFQQVDDGDDVWAPTDESESAQLTVYSTTRGEPDASAVGDYELALGTLHVEFFIADVGSTLGGAVDGEANFAIVDSDGVTQEIIDGVEPGDHDEGALLTPGTYTVELDESSLVDTWGNDFEVEIYQGLGEPVTVDADEVTNHQVLSRVPTMVITETDDADTVGSLREVVDRVNAGSAISFDFPVETIGLTEGEIVIDKPLGLIGDGDIAIEAANEDQRLFHLDGIEEAGVDDEVVLLEYITLRNGDASTGGAVRIGEVDDVVVQLSNVEFDSNRADTEGGALFVSSAADTQMNFEAVGFFDNSTGGAGGAVYVEEGAQAVTIDSGLFVDNTAETAAGGAIASSESLTVEAVEFRQNTAVDGGAVHAGDAAFDRVEFSDNSASERGGALYVAPDAEGEVVVDRTLFSNNEADDGGGGLFVDGSVYVENTTFDANTTDAEGGAALFADTAMAELYFITAIDNEAAEGAALYNDGSGDIFLRASYLADNPGADDIETSGPGNAVQSRGYNLVSTVEDGGGNPDFESEGTDETNTDDHAYGELEGAGGFTPTRAIEEGTPGHLDIPADECIDRDDEPVERDQRGFDRPVEDDGEEWCTFGAREDS